ncbi:glycosyltransferase family 2 protein, partial [bacterium]
CGFGSQKKFALEQATGDWVLSLDADERITENAKQEILKKVSEAKFDGFYFRRNNFILGKFIADAKPANLRLFKRSRAVFSPSLVHESVILTGRAGVIKEPIEHFSRNMADVASCLKSVNHYSSLSAQSLYLRGRRLNCFTAPLYIVGYPCYIFIRFAVVGGFFTGRTGFVLLFMRMLEGFLNYLKLWEIQNKK